MAPKNKQRIPRVKDEEGVFVRLIEKSRINEETEE